jgi:hypothetical protein
MLFRLNQKSRTPNLPGDLHSLASFSCASARADVTAAQGRALCADGSRPMPSSRIVPRNIGNLKTWLAASQLQGQQIICTVCMHACLALSFLSIFLSL